MATRDLMKNNLTFLEFDSYLSEKEPFKSYSMDHTDLKRLQDGHVGGQVREGEQMQRHIICLMMARITAKVVSSLCSTKSDNQLLIT